MKYAERMETAGSDMLGTKLHNAFVWAPGDRCLCIYCGSFLKHDSTTPCWREPCRILASLEKRTWGGEYLND